MQSCEAATDLVAAFRLLPSKETRYMRKAEQALPLK